MESELFLEWTDYREVPVVEMVTSVIGPTVATISIPASNKVRFSKGIYHTKPLHWWLLIIRKHQCSGLVWYHIVLNKHACLNKCTPTSSSWHHTPTFWWPRPKTQVKNGSEMGAIGWKHLCCSSGLPGLSWMPVNVQGAFIQHYTVF